MLMNHLQKCLLSNQNKKPILKSATTIAQNRGGTGITSYSPGDILYTDASGNLVKLPIGTTDQLMQVTASGGYHCYPVIDGGDY